MWSLAWPIMLSVFFYTLYNVIDAYWVSKISPEAIAAVSISQITLFVMISLGFGITAGSGVIMAMNIGAKNMKEAERILGQSFVLSAILGVFFTIIALIFRTGLLTLSGASGNIFQPALEYFTIISGGAVLLFLMFAIMFGFNSQGDTHGLTKLFAVSTGLNLILDPILIFGWIGMPEMGISGAALATLISQSVFIILGIRSLKKQNRMIKFHFKNLNVKWGSVKKVLNIGFPASLTNIIFPLGLAGLTFLISSAFLEPGTIAFSIGSRIEFFAYLPAIGFGFGAMAMIGQSIGAGNLNRAKTIFRKGLKYAFWASLGLGILAAIFAKPIVEIFTDDPLVIKYALTYMRSVTFGYGFLSAVLLEASAFQAIGKSWPGFWMFFLRVIIITLPLAYIFTRVFDLSIWFVWIGVIIGDLITATLGYFWIKKKLDNYDLKKAPVHSMSSGY